MAQTSKESNQIINFNRRLFIFSVLNGLIFIVIISFLFFLQIIKGPDYERKAKSNREQFAILPAVRGVIYDRSEKSILACNRRSFAVNVVPQNFPEDKEEKRQLLQKLAILLNIKMDDILGKINKKNYSQFGSYVIKTGVPFKDIVFLAEHNKDFPGVYWKSKPIRVYPYEDMFVNVVGYVGMINEKELAELSEKGCNIESIIGKSGIEKVYDLQLKGKDGYIKRIVDATNQVTAEIIDSGGQPIPGNNLILTIDKTIQSISERALGDKIGAVVVSKPNTGEILAIVSYPRFNPNLFVSQEKKDFFKELALDKRKPFLNRAIQAQYPAGSIFKLVDAMAILDTDVIPVDKEFMCGGGYRLGNRFFSCWRNHGIVNLRKAIVESCDSYFYQVSLILGSEMISKYAERFGFGRRLGIDLIGELSGVVPCPQWKIKNKEEMWYDGDTLNLAIGQGYLLVTPLQINALTNIIVNKGILYKPYVVKEIRSAKNGEILFKRDREVLIDAKIDKSKFDFIIDAMRGVVAEGTAKWGGAVLSTQMAGKTSSAEVVGEETHAWFTAFAPYNAEDPEDVVSVTVIVEHGGAGSVSAAPIVSQIVESIFSKSDLEEAKRNIWKKRMETYKKTKGDLNR